MPSKPMSAVKPYATVSLEAMTTRRLLGHLSRLRACQESLAVSDLAGQPLPSDYDPVAHIYFKDDPRWQQQSKEVKRILAAREHIERPAERRQESLRRKKAQEPQKKTRRTRKQSGRWLQQPSWFIDHRSTCGALASATLPRRAIMPFAGYDPTQAAALADDL